MGEVYRACDTRLERTVAIKILPGHLASDPAFRARFEREARAVSALSHPNICTLHDIGEQDGVLFLVLEHLEGETLASRLGRGPMPPEEALPFATQIALALAQAHRQGVIHRDLKPANVVLTRNGAKLLDFGLAKQGPQAVPPMSSALMTEASPLTAAGTIVGTWQYMAPEQLEGAEADARSDIFAFGAMMYEMMTGRRAFEGRSQASLIAAIMSTQPPALSAVVPGVPSPLDRVVRRCLAKDPDDRWQSAADLASELKWITGRDAPEGDSLSGVTAPSVAGVAVPGSTPGATAPAIESREAGKSRRLGRERLVWAVLTIALLATIAALAARSFLGSGMPPRRVTAALLPPAGATFDTRYAPAISPDGEMVASVVIGAEGKSSLYLRRLERDEIRQLPDSENAAHPFWSPDSRWIGFFSNGKLRKVDTAGGPAIALCDGYDGRGGAWNRDGVIIFQPRFSDPLFKVAAGGGTPEPLTKLDDGQFHISHRFPTFLPDGRRFLFYVVATTNPSTSEHSGIYLGSLDSPEIRRVLRVDSRMAYAQGDLLYKRGSTLMAQPFDPESATLTGDPLPLAAGVSGGAYSWGGADFSVSDQGVLAYRSGSGEGQTELVWLDRSGKRVGQLGPADYYYDLRISRDGRKMAVNVGKDAGDLWLHDLERDVRTRFTFDPADDNAPIFSPDGALIAFVSARNGMGELYARDTQGTGQDVLLFPSLGTQLTAGDWSPDGRSIIFSSLSRKTHFDLWTYSVQDKKAEPWLEGPLDQTHARFSPNGRWVAYESNESGHEEIYVQTFPEKGGGRWQVSRSGGSAPTWRADGKEIYFIGSDDSLMAADVRIEGTFDAGTPHPLFRAQFRSSIGMTYDVDPDGQRFLANTSKETDRSGQSVTVVLDWPAILRR
jgi:Tol biopolymer transport system component